jgi:hypothetical protein
VNRILLMVVVLTMLSGCVSYPQGVGLETASGKGFHADSGIWLAPAAIHSGLKQEDREAAETSMTLSLQKFLEETGVFTKIVVLPANVPSDGHVLHFEFKNYSVSRKAHPAYFPAAILTLTFYIWFNGPIYIDTVNIDAGLYVTDAAGKPVAEFSETIKDKINVGFSDPEYYMPSGIKQRTAAVNGLVDQYIVFLQKNKKTGVSYAIDQ